MPAVSSIVPLNWNKEASIVLSKWGFLRFIFVVGEGQHIVLFFIAGIYRDNAYGSRLQRVKRCKETALYKWVLVVDELFNIAVNYFDATNLLIVTWFSL